MGHIKFSAFKVLLNGHMRYTYKHTETHGMVNSIIDRIFTTQISQSRRKSREEVHKKTMSPDSSVASYITENKIVFKNNRNTASIFVPQKDLKQHNI